jgi:hypothetical protein
MHLKYVLRQINPGRCNLHGGRSYPVSGCSTLPLWHVDAVKGGGVHPIAFGRLLTDWPLLPDLTPTRRS